MSEQEASHLPMDPNLVLLCDNIDADEYRDPSRATVTIKDAIRYIAFGNFHGESREQHYSNHHDIDGKARGHMWYGQRNVALRILERAIRMGQVAVLFVSDHLEYEDNPCLWKVRHEAFASGVHINFHGRKQDYIPYDSYWIESEDETVSFPDPLLFAAEIKLLADPENSAVATAMMPDSVRQTGNDKPNKGGRPAGTNGAPMAAFMLKLQSMGREEALALTEEALGAELRAEYKPLGLKPPHPDNARRDAKGVRAVLYPGETSGD